MEKENIMPIVLGAGDAPFVRRYAKLYGSPVAVLDTERNLRITFITSAKFIKMKSAEDEIVLMYIASLLEETDRMPLLAAVGPQYRGFVERNREALSALCILWHENFEF